MHRATPIKAVLIFRWVVPGVLPRGRDNVASGGGRKIYSTLGLSRSTMATDILYIVSVDSARVDLVFHALLRISPHLHHVVQRLPTNQRLDVPCPSLKSMAFLFVVCVTVVNTPHSAYGVPENALGSVWSDSEFR
jgi:hypothetical protein